jgi:hypothetical protein
VSFPSVHEGVSAASSLSQAAELSALPPPLTVVAAKTLVRIRRWTTQVSRKSGRRRYGCPWIVFLSHRYHISIHDGGEGRRAPRHHRRPLKPVPLAEGPILLYAPYISYEDHAWKSTLILRIGNCENANGSLFLAGHKCQHDRQWTHRNWLEMLPILPVPLSESPNALPIAGNCKPSPSDVATSLMDALRSAAGPAATGKPFR